MDPGHTSAPYGPFLLVAVAAFLLAYLAMRMCNRRGLGRAKIDRCLTSYDAFQTSPIFQDQPLDISVVPRFSLLQELPADVLRRVVELLMKGRAANITALCKTSRGFRHLRTEAERIWLCWQPKFIVGCQILDDRLSVQRIALPSKYAFHARGFSCHSTSHTAAGSLLPATGRYSWTIHVGRSANNQGMVAIGVCDAGVHYGWGLHPGNGQIGFRAMAGCGPPPPQPDYGVRLQALAGCPFEQPAVQLDSGEWHYAPLAIATLGQAIPQHEILGFRNPANSNTDVEVVVDRDAGTVAFRLNGGPLSASLTGFPPGVMLRPYRCRDF